MPQGSLLDEFDFDRLHMTFAANRVQDTGTVQLIAENRRGTILASLGLMVMTYEEQSLLPELARKAALGYCFGSPQESVHDTGAWYRHERSLLGHFE